MRQNADRMGTKRTMQKPLLFAELQNRVMELELKGEEGISTLLDLIIERALAQRATDIHIDCRKNDLRVQYRIDGTLFPAATVAKKTQEILIGRLKVMSRVMSYKKRMPQDGRIEFDLAGQLVLLRSSFMPTLYGEKVVLRLPDESLRGFEIETLGLPEAVQEKLLRIISSLNGTILLTGPSSSGKTTTIYSILKRLTQLFSDRLNICTLEDPVESELEGVNQTPLDPAGGLDYASGLRAILRQDPNVIVIGEIRDETTARIAVQAGLTGHLVISTIHSGTAAGVFTRLLNMQIEPFLVASSVSCVIAQRLVRRICSGCREPYELSGAERESLGLREDIPAAFFRAKGCEQCAGIGYKGRIGVFEMLSVSEPLRESVLQRRPTSDIQALAAREGMKTLKDHAVEKLLQGITSVDEVSRIFFT
jgi:type II secretory ATPase GspE/PulE/Tfp pilus assembly ATPase PilB-like protein